MLLLQQTPTHIYQWSIQWNRILYIKKYYVNIIYFQR